MEVLDFSEDALLAAVAEEDCFDGDCGEGGMAALALVQNYAMYRQAAKRQASKHQVQNHDPLLAAVMEEDGGAPALSLMQETAKMNKHRRVGEKEEMRDGAETKQKEETAQREKAEKEETRAEAASAADADKQKLAALESDVLEVSAGNQQFSQYSLEEIAKHNLDSDCWLIIHDKVVDVTNYLSKHPGGSQILLDYAGKDCTDKFDEIHPDYVLTRFLPQLVIGQVQKVATAAVVAAPAAVVVPVVTAATLLEEGCSGTECGTALVQQSVVMKRPGAEQTPRHAVMSVGADGFIEDASSHGMSSSLGVGMAHMSVNADGNVMFY